MMDSWTLVPYNINDMLACASGFCSGTLTAYAVHHSLKHSQAWFGYTMNPEFIMLQVCKEHALAELINIQESTFRFCQQCAKVRMLHEP